VPIVFLNPWGGLVVLLLVLPVVAFLRLRDRDRAVRTTLGLPPATRRALLAPVAAAVVAGVLLAVAAMQPALVRSSSQPRRSDAELLFVLDISRSMLASSGPGAPTRIERAKRIAERIRGAVPGVPAGIASVTDRVLPYALATSDEGVFVSTLQQAVAVDVPPPTNIYYDRATDLGVLADIPGRSFFSTGIRKRVVVVLSDGESRPVQAQRLRALSPIFVHVWQPDDRVFATGRPDKTYRSDPNSGAFLAGLGRTVEERDAGAAIAAVRRGVGAGPTEPVRDHSYVGLMRPLVLLALVPLLFVLWRRNGWAPRRLHSLASESRNTWLVSRKLSRIEATD
jgi:hypothetical protein